MKSIGCFGVKLLAQNLVLRAMYANTGSADDRRGLMLASDNVTMRVISSATILRVANSLEDDETPIIRILVIRQRDSETRRFRVIYE